MGAGKFKYSISLIICCIGFLPLLTSAQKVEVSLNRNTILIGEQISYGLKVEMPATGLKANFNIPDSVPHFEILRKDEVKAVGTTALEQVITFTSFDSGSWYFPSIPVLITDGVRKRTFLSDSILIHVGYMPADSSGMLRDIKPVMDVNFIDYTIYYIIVGILLLLLIAFLIYRYYKNRKKKPAPLFKADLSPYDEAMEGLKQIGESPLSDKQQVKEFHTKLSDVFKRYYSRRTNRDLLNKTTGDILVELREANLKPEIISGAAEGLRYTDAVKFAKFVPLYNESKSALDIIKRSIEQLETNLPPKI
jgi:hypothetical protein